jgi:hypothetical protein
MSESRPTSHYSQNKSEFDNSIINVLIAKSRPNYEFHSQQVQAGTVKRIPAPIHIRRWQCKQRLQLSEEVAKVVIDGYYFEKTGTWRKGVDYF